MQGHPERSKAGSRRPPANAYPPELEEHQEVNTSPLAIWKEERDVDHEEEGGNLNPLGACCIPSTVPST